MTQDEIIEMAIKVDLNGHELAYSDWFKNRLKAFAKLVAEHEREACAKVCEDISITGILLDAISCNHTKNFCAHTIRARGKA